LVVPNLGAGLILVPLLAVPIARNLPLGTLPDRLTTAALGEGGWSAGAGLMSRAISYPTQEHG